MNNNQTTAHARYEAHVKESLLAGKPVEYRLKDFLPKDNKSKTKRSRPKTKYEKMVLEAFEEGKIMFPKMHEDVTIRHAYIKSTIMHWMSECESIDEVKELYNTYKRITYNTPVFEY